MNRNTLIVQSTLGTLICLAAAQMSQAMFEAISELDQPTYETVRLVSSDGKSFALPKEVAFISEFVRTSLTGAFREAAGPTRIFTQRGMSDLPHTVRVDIPGKELNVLVQIMRLLHKHRADAKAQANAIARMPRIKSDNVGALIHDADFLQLPETCTTGLIDRLAEFINQQEITEIPFDDRKMLTQLVRTYFLKYDEDLGLTDAENNPIDTGGFSIRELLDAGKEFTINRFSTVPKCDLKNMRISSLDGLSDIPEIGECFELDLSNNQIAAIPQGAFRGMPKLHFLILKNNRITSILPDTFQETPNLWSLQLDKNQISSISPNAFRGLPALTQLYLANNRITTIDASAFAGLAKLESFNLSSNQIDTIQANAFQGLSSLKKILLIGNQIHSVHLDAFQVQGLPELKLIALDYNRLSHETIMKLRERLPWGSTLDAQSQQTEHRRKTQKL